MMPDEVRSTDSESLVAMLNEERAVRLTLEERVRELEAENRALRGQLCQCRLDAEVADL